MKRARTFLHAWLPPIFMMGTIFYFSHQPATESSKLSGSIVDIVVAIVSVVAPFIPFDEELLHLFIRKGAHFTIYLLLGVTLVRACSFYVNRNRGMFYAFVIAVLYAISDEVHQLFIPGRSGEVGDVVIDSCGALTGVFIYTFVRRNSS